MKPSIPIIAQTAYAMAEDIIKGKNAGCDDYLSKPIKPELLISTLRHFLYITETTDWFIDNSILIFSNLVYTKHTNSCKQ